MNGSTRKMKRATNPYSARKIKIHIVMRTNTQIYIHTYNVYNTTHNKKQHLTYTTPNTQQSNDTEHVHAGTHTQHTSQHIANPTMGASMQKIKFYSKSTFGS